MKHFISIALFAIIFSTIANAQQGCKVPISVQLGDEQINTVLIKDDVLAYSFMKYLERNGFTTEVNNTRVAISLNLTPVYETAIGGSKKSSVKISFIDAFSKKVFYSTELTKEYGGSSEAAREALAADFNSSIPELDSLAEAIRTSVIDAFEINTNHVAEVAQQYAVQGDHKVSFFALSQYPTCCKSYPKIRNYIVALFRDYIKRDHDALFDIIYSVLDSMKTENDARFIVSLINRGYLDESEMMKANIILGKVGEAYPSLNLDANEDFTAIAELRTIAVREARTIGIEYSGSDAVFPKIENFIPSDTQDDLKDRHNSYKDDWYHSYMDYYCMKTEFGYDSYSYYGY